MKKALLILLVSFFAVKGHAKDDGFRSFVAADGVTDTYTLLNQNGYYEEVPDLGYNSDIPDCGHDVKHITQSWDEQLNKYVFNFSLHVENGFIDTDRCLSRMSDKQRTEIKTFGKSPEQMCGARGQTHTYNWKFRLAEDHRPTESFTHVHQIKASGGTDQGMPLITFSTNLKPSTFDVKFFAPKTKSPTYIARLDLAEFTGEWIEATETVTFDTDGDYYVKLVRIRDGKVLLEARGNYDFWREGADFMRPKYGIYRRTYTDKAQSRMLEMKDETIQFADFLLIEYTK